MAIIRKFVLVFRDLPISTQEVKAGLNSAQIVTACRCVNVGLFLSGDLRRDVKVEFIIGTAEDLRVISFPGATLRRVSPDERSISFFLLKASLALDDLSMGEQRVLDNGIMVKRRRMNEILSELEEYPLYVASRDCKRVSEISQNLDRGAFWYTIDREIEEFSKVRGDKVYRYQAPERFILEVNHSADGIECH